jgi:hypothetical protein
MKMRMTRTSLLTSSLWFAAALGVAVCSVTGCSDETNARVVTKINQDAGLTGNLPYNPLAWRVITSWIDKNNSTMSTLFGNDLAVQYARTHAGQDFPAGAVVSLVTWKEQEDPRWFGGKIPAAPQSVEFVIVAAGADRQPSFTWQKYEGAPLKKISPAEEQKGPAPVMRAAFLLSQRAAVMP